MSRSRDDQVALTLVPRRRGPEPALLERCLAGDGAAWDALYRQLYPVARAFLRRLGLSTTDADDACQEVFIQVHRYLARFEHRAELTTWLYRVCASQAARVRRRLAIAQLASRVKGHEPTMPSPTALSSSESRLVVEQVLRRMKLRNAIVFVLFELEELPGEEIARIVGRPLNTVWRRLHDARKEFEATLARLEGKAT